ncbi:fumarylacetoacetate hydrolase family protein [Tsukamurella soli]|uniref:Fumarylacetoacetate hydrolase family protein n=2 Tax=Tsukamurella soli TaxID=644556 RepID=A0ABP8JSZ4_9ACTN
MRIANLSGRSVLVVPGQQLGEVGVIDVARRSGGRFGPDPQALYGDWAAFRAWADGADRTPDRILCPGPAFGPPVPDPRQIFAVGLNYGERSSEAGAPDDAIPPVFTKFPTSLAGAFATVELPTDTVDWEVELVLVLGTDAYRITEDRVADVVAGAMVGQDLTDRASQFVRPWPQFGLSKSYPGFAPTGPWLSTLDELGALDDLTLSCRIDGELMQRDSTASMRVGATRLIAELSQRVRLTAGDLVFTGSPGGVGHYRTPPRYLRPGNRLESEITGLGTQLVTLIPTTAL